MTISSVSIIIDRIKSATKESPIAVFKAEDGKLDAVFADTIETQKLIKADSPSLIGVYHSGFKMFEVRKFLEFHSVEPLAA